MTASAANGALRVALDCVYFETPQGAQRRVLENIAFEARPGTLTAITGPSGCGKSTLLNAIARLIESYEGRIEPPPASAGEIGVAYMFQEPRLLPWRTLRDNIRLVCDADDDAIDATLAELELGGAAGKYPGEVSLGMARRAALARTLAVAAPLLLLDEPFNSLDNPTAVRLRAWLRKRLAARRCVTLMVTHNLREALFLADRLLIVSGSPATLAADVPLEHPGDDEDRAASALKALEARLLQEFGDALVENS